MAITPEDPKPPPEREQPRKPGHDAPQREPQRGPSDPLPPIEPPDPGKHRSNKTDDPALPGQPPEIITDDEPRRE